MRNYPLSQHEDNVVAFDYSTLTDGERLATLDNEKKLNDLYERYQPEVGEILYNQQKILANHNDGVFQQWYESKGFKRWKVYDYINKYQYVIRNSEDPKKIDIFESMPKTLQSEMSKPSAKEEVNQAVYDGDITTHKEYKKLEKQLKEKDQQIENIKWDNAQKDEEIEAARKETKIIEKEIIKEIKPDDYDELRLNNQQLNNALREANRSHDLMQEQYNHLVLQQKEEDENSKKYEELTQAIQEMEGKMDRTQKLIQAQKQVYELVDMSKDLLMKITPIPYLIDSELVRDNPVAKRELEKIANQTQSFLDNLNEALKESQIMEGEFTDA